MENAREAVVALNGPNMEEWGRLGAANPEQSLVVNAFKFFDEYNPGQMGMQACEILREELSVWDMSRVELFTNYNIFKVMRKFLVAHQVDVPAFHLGKNILMLRIVAAIWPENQFANERNEALERWEASKRGNISVPPAGNLGGLTRHEFQTPRPERNRPANNQTEPRKRLFDDSNAGLFAKVQACYKGEKQKFLLELRKKTGRSNSQSTNALQLNCSLAGDKM